MGRKMVSVVRCEGEGKKEGGGGQGDRWGRSAVDPIFYFDTDRRLG